MKGLLLSLLGVLLVTLLATPTLGGGWIWDVGNALGFVAFAGLLYLSMSSGNGIDVKAHQFLGFAVLGVATAHTFWFLLLDPAVIEYVKPGAPLYMWMGVISFLLLAVLILIGLPEYRLRLHKRYSKFKYWHRILAIVTIVGAGYHVVVSGFYLHTKYQVVLFLVLTAAVLSGYRSLGRSDALTTRPSRYYLAVATLWVLLFAGVKNVSL